MQKISDKNIENAKAVFKKYLAENRIVEKITNSLSSLDINSPKLKEDLQYLTDNSEKIFTANIDEIKEHNINLEHFYNVLKNISPQKRKTPKQKEALKIAKCFKHLYTNFSQNKEYAYKLSEALNIKTCPYCNIGYTYNVTKEDENGEEKYLARPAFDHYYCQNFYPYLALSFYNLIPSCSICNSSFKSNEDFDPIHPYIESFDKLATFDIDIKNYPNLYNDTNAFEIKLYTESDKAQAHIDKFALNERYKYHKDVAQEILIKKKCYTEEHIEVIKNFLEKEKIKYTDEFIDCIITGNYTEEECINKRPLVKLNKDLWNIEKKTPLP